MMASENGSAHSSASRYQRAITIPKGPRLATMERLGDKSSPTSGSTASSGSSIGSRGSPIDHRMLSTSTHSAGTPRARVRKGVAPSSSSSLSTPRSSSDRNVVDYSRRTPTIPRGPRFSTLTKREKPQSTAEREKEMMEYFKANPFKAKPILKYKNQSDDEDENNTNSNNDQDSVATSRSAAVGPRPTTKPKPFNFQTSQRSVLRTSSLKSCRDDDNNDEGKRSKSNNKSNSSGGRREITIPKPFNFHTTTRSSGK